MENFYPRKILVDKSENDILQFIYKEQTFLLNKGREFMQEQLKKKHKELRDKMRKCDEELLRLLKQGHREIILRVITDYLSQRES